MFYFDNIGDKKIMKSTVLDGLEHFFTTRESLIKTKEIDNTKLAKNNREFFCKYLNVDNIISPKQTHSSNVRIVSKGMNEYNDTDGLILTSVGAIALNFADCTPLIFYDGEIVAISHAGWRGTALKISHVTLDIMINELNSDIKNIKCAIGPAISMCCYNVQEDVAQKLLSTVKNFDNLYEKRNNNIYVDLKNINRQQLIEYGINQNNIDVCPYCTVCNNDLFYSYRKENGVTNRHSAVVCIK